MVRTAQAPSWLNKARTSISRLAGRLAPRLQSRLDERLDGLSETLDAWNQRLAQRALPADRRNRVDALTRRGTRRKLRVVSGVTRPDKKI